MPTRLEERLQDYQRNAAFIGFVSVVCFAAFVYLTQSLREMLIPLIWSAFFAVPLCGLIAAIDDLLIIGSSRLMRQSPLNAVSFTAVTGSSAVSVRRSQNLDMLLARVNRPWGCCRRRVRIRNLRVTADEGVHLDHAGGMHAEPSQGSESTNLLEEGRPRARTVVEELLGPEVNRLVEGWVYYIDASHYDETHGSDQPNGEVELRLYCDQAHQYPAVLEGGSARDVALLPRAGGPGQLRLSGVLEVDRTSALSWFFALVVSVLVMLLGVWLFVYLVIMGVADLKSHLGDYQKGVTDVVEWAARTFKEMLPKEIWDEMTKSAERLVKEWLPSLASQLAAGFENVAWQVMLFIIYLLFWVSEPLPISGDVAKVFKAYLFLKTGVCLLYALLMSLLLFCLGCRLWHIFFVITFLLNYIPELGAIMSALLMLPAILFDGSQSLVLRGGHVALLVIFGTLFKVVTGNVIEVRLYATKGGQFMRMHPVILMALMMLCSVLLGITGMFLAIPIIAAIKYYLITSEMPETYIHPLLALLEGDETGPHRNFVDQHPHTGAANAAATDPRPSPPRSFSAGLPGTSFGDGVDGARHGPREVEVGTGGASNAARCEELRTYHRESPGLELEAGSTERAAAPPPNAR